ncbi:hypothetical protein K438DRAFT_1972132 [Mycena galopus ATCC 62051]|nr:hypothetical protein K438DRAFT_1972132 [Mycena galopus ATCC 62051]
MSTSASTIRTLHARPSPPHSPFQSPPDSPSLSASGSSVSSFPSVSSSFFFSSAAASPPPESHPHPHPNGVEENLIIPSLTLPALLIGPHMRVKGPRTRLLVLGRPDVAIAALFADDPDALEANAWVDEDGFRVLRASAQWREYDNHGYDDDESNSNARGTERHNVELVALGENIQQLDIAAIENRILEPFRNVSALLAPPLLSSPHEEDLLTALLAGPEVPLYTALLIVPPSLPSSTHPSPFSSTISSVLSTPASTSNSLTVDSALPFDAPNSISASGSHAAEHAAPLASLASLPGTDITSIPDTLRRLVPVIVLAPEPVPAYHPRSDSHSLSHSRHPRSDADSDEEEDTDEEEDEDSGIAIAIALPPPSPAASSESALDVPPTARLPAKRPQYVERGRTERTIGHPTQTEAGTGTRTETGTNTNTHTHPAFPAYTPSALRPGAPAARKLRTDAAKCFVRWWRAGGGDPYAKVDVNPPGYLHDPHADAPRGDRDDHPASLPRLAVHLRPAEKARAHYPGAYGYAQNHVYAYRNVRADRDPLHLPSLLALAREVVRAWGVSSGSRATGVKGEYRVEGEYEEDSERDGGVEAGERGARRRRRGGTGWGRVGAFVAGVLLGVGVGVWAAAGVGVGAGVWEGVLVVVR